MIRSIIIPTFVYLSILFFVYGSAQLSDRIINGNIVDGKEFPWKVAIRGVAPAYKWDFLKLFPRVTYCGASILNERWIITAAHCFDPRDKKMSKNAYLKPKIWHARIGSEKLEANMKDRLNSYLNRMWNVMTKGNRKQEYYHFEKIIVHPDYTPDVLEHDIAIVKLKETLPLQNLGAAEIPLPKANQTNSWPSSGEICTIVGWGCSKTDGEMMRLAQHTQLEVISGDQCRQYYKGDINLTETKEFCAGYYNRGIGICPGDSGSALVCKHSNRWVMAGITSATHRLYPESFPGIFTRVSAYVNWIGQALAAN